MDLDDGYAKTNSPPTTPAYTLETMIADAPEIVLAAPRGYCAGVERAVQAVEAALDLYGAPVYVRKEIVHNKHVVDQLRERGAIFVDSESEVPEDATVVFSAHGVAPSVHANSEKRRLRTIDATCPLVTKVHVEARKFAADDYTIVLIGHDGHEEVEGTMGEAPKNIVLVQSVRDVDRLEIKDPEQDRLYLADHALGGRDASDHQPPAPALPGDRGAPHRRHLLRDHQPPDSRQAARPHLRPGARDRLAQLL